MQANGQKDPQELRGFLNDVRQAAYTIRNHMERNFGEQEQTFTKDDFSFEEPPKQAPKKEKKEKEGGFWQKLSRIIFGEDEEEEKHAVDIGNTQGADVREI